MQQIRKNVPLLLPLLLNFFIHSRTANSKKAKNVGANVNFGEQILTPCGTVKQNIFQFTVPRYQSHKKICPPLNNYRKSSC